MKAKILLKGSCQCQAVKFSLRSAHIFPYQRCYCSICRKVQGGGGYAINLAGDYRTLKISGEKYLKRYHARMKDRGEKRGHLSSAWRYFCGECGTSLWLYDPDWPELVHPYASAIDTPLPVAPEITHSMLSSKASWVQPHFGPRDKKFEVFSDESIAEWHERLGLVNKRKRE